MKVLNNLHMTASGNMVSVGWNELNGDRMHVWLEVKDGEPVVPYRVRLERRIGHTKEKETRTLYRNPPTGTPYKGVRYFQTRYLNTEAKAWRTIVAEALDRALHEGLLAKARAAATAAKEAEQRAAELKLLDKVRTVLGERKFADTNAQWWADELVKCDDAILLELAYAFRRAT